MLPLRFSNTSYTLQYNVTNDDKNLYVCILSTDDNTQLSILRSGMTLYFDPKGKKNKEISVHFPIQKPADAGSGGRPGGMGMRGMGMGMRGGGMGGGGGRRYGGGGQPPQKEDDNWYVFRLVTKTIITLKRSAG